jgi:glycosyltransferase involved in cell wall biosynthesis
MTRIAFVIDLADSWAGGASYFENLFRAIRAADTSGTVKLIGILQGNIGRQTILEFLDEYYPYPSLAPVSPVSQPKPLSFARLKRIGEKIETRIKKVFEAGKRPAESLFSRSLKTFHPDVTFLRNSPGPGFDIPSLGWFPDFQYIHLPEMFKEGETELLHNFVNELAIYNDRIFLSSNTALNDFKTAFPDHAHKGRVLQFVADMDASIYRRSPAWVCEYYHISKRFFFLPNQIWKHKNHLGVLKALSVAREKDPGIKVVSSGLFSDYRHPLYPSEVLAQISEMNLREHFIPLGYIPKEHVLTLARQSLAVLQPSFFEGWSTTVEEAKSLGKEVILSDTPIHREQAPSHATFFDVQDPEALARVLVTFNAEKDPGPDLALEEEARMLLPERKRIFGLTFLGHVEEVKR